MSPFRALSPIATIVAALVYSTSCPVAAAAEAAPWMQWRGPHRDGRIEASPWPSTLEGDALEMLWRVAGGPSYSGPILAADRVFVTETDQETDEVVRALDRSTGKELWNARWKGAMKVPFFARSNGDWIRATPAHDGDALYVAGMRDLLVCLDAATGAERWRVDFVERFSSALPDFGFVSSPLVMSEHIYVQAGGSVVKLDKRTGGTVWRAMDDGGGMWGSAFSSPVLAQLAGREQLVVQSRSHLAGLDPQSGQVLWKHEVPAFRGMNILTPQLLGDRIFTSAYGGKSRLFDLKAGADGALTIDEAWANKTQGYMSSPIVHQGHAYLHLRNRRVTCIDLATGKESWTTKPFGEYWSMIANGDHILALDEQGELLLLEANPAEFTLLSRRKISSEPTWAHLAISGDQLVVRELHATAAYRWRGANGD